MECHGPFLTVMREDATKHLRSPAHREMTTSTPKNLGASKMKSFKIAPRCPELWGLSSLASYTKKNQNLMYLYGKSSSSSRNNRTKTFTKNIRNIFNFWFFSTKLTLAAISGWILPPWGWLVVASHWTQVELAWLTPQGETSFFCSDSMGFRGCQFNGSFV